VTVALRNNQRIKATRAGTFKLNLPPDERQLLAHLLPQVKELVSSPPEASDGRIRRLFPVAYATDPERDAEYQHFMRDELVTSRLAAIDTVLATVDAKELSEDQLMAWMRSVNSIRLVLGTMLDVREDPDEDDIAPDDPLFGEHALYNYLSFLLETIIEALGDPSP
jgi:Domain of unknown function (DUF2017)